MPEVTVTLTLKVAIDGRTDVTTFKPHTNAEPERALTILEEAAKRLAGQEQLPLDAGDAEPSFVGTFRPGPDGKPDPDLEPEPAA